MTEHGEGSTRRRLALEAAREVVVGVGIDDGPTEVVREGTSVLVRFVSAGVLARVDDQVPVSRSQRQVDVAKVLARFGVPAVRLVGDPDALPVVVDRPSEGWAAAVSLWNWEPTLDRLVGPGELGELAQTLRHATGALAPEDQPVWQLQPLEAVAEQLDLVRASSTPTPVSEIELLEGVAAGLAPRWSDAVAASPDRSLVHGDLHAGNVLATSRGALLVDLELAGWGASDYDLAPQVVARRRYGASNAELAAFVDGYGSVLPSTDAFEVFVEVYELWVTLWAVANRGLDDHHEAEAQRRLDRWRGSVDSPLWTLR